MENKDLIHRLNRITGQINSIKKSLEGEGAFECKATLQQLKAAINGLKKFGEAYVKVKLDTCFEGASPEVVKKELNEVIALTFSL